MLELIIIFVVVYGAVWAVRTSVNKRTWNDLVAKIPGGKPQNILVVSSSLTDLAAVKAKLDVAISNSNYKIAADSGNVIVLEDKKASVNPLNTMYFYPVYLSVDQSGKPHTEVGIVDKSSFLGSRQDRLKKLQAMFGFLSGALQ